MSRLQIYLQPGGAEVSNVLVTRDRIRPNDPSKDMVLRNVEIRIEEDAPPVPSFQHCWSGGPLWPRTVAPPPQDC